MFAGFLPLHIFLSPRAAELEPTYLFSRCVFDSLRVIVVINDVKIFDGGGEGHVHGSFPGSFGQHCEVSWLPAFYT